MTFVQMHIDRTQRMLKKHYFEFFEKPLLFSFASEGYTTGLPTDVSTSRQSNR